MTAAPRSRNLFIVANNIQESGGVQRVVHGLAQNFSRLGHSVQLIGIHSDPEPVRYIDSPLYREFTLYEGYSAPARWAPRTWRDRLNRRAIRAEAQRKQTHEAGLAKMTAAFNSVPDGLVIVSQIYAMDWVAEANPTHLRIIGQVHESYEAARGLTAATVGSTRHKRVMKLFADIDLVQTLTRADADKFERDGLNNTAVMHNPLSFYPDTAAALENKTVISIGRYHPQKNYSALISAWQLVHERHPDWQLKIFGSGEEEEALRGQIQRAGLTGSAALMGLTTEPEKELLDSSIFALSSDFEGLPLVLCEAMACGVPCVSFDCAPGIREIIADGVDGLVVPPRDIKALADGICRLIEDPALRRDLGAAARQNIRRYSTEEIMQRWHEVFEMIDR